MIGFVKWLYMQYQSYKLEQIINNTTDEQKHSLFMENFRRCVEVGFSEEQIYALLNLLSSTK